MASNYPSGFLNGLTLRGVPINLMHPGEVFFVNNSGVLAKGGIGGSDGNPGTYQKPFSTVDYAIGRCTASRGDIIAVMPGHAENITGTATITSDVAGVAVVGLGAGSLRPKFSWTAATATWSVAAGNLSFYNLGFESNISDATIGVSLTAAADDCTFDECHWTEAGSNLNWGAGAACTLATGCDRLAWYNCSCIMDDIANDAWISGVAHDGFTMVNCYVAANTAQTAAHGLVDASGNVTNILIKNCDFISAVDDALWIDFNGTCSGIIKNCMVSSIDDAGAVTTGDATGAHFFECYVSGESTKFGLIGGESTVYVNA